MTGPEPDAAAPAPIPPLDPNRDPLEDYLDAILTARSRASQLRFLHMMWDDVTCKVRGQAANLIQDTLLAVRVLPSPPV